MARRFDLVITIAVTAFCLAGITMAGPARAQEAPEVWLTPPVRAGSDSSSSDPLLFYFAGNDSAFSGNLPAAIRLYRRALAADTSQNGVRLALARVYAAEEQPDSTLFWALETLRRNPGLAEAHRLAGISYLRLREPRLATDALRQAVQLDSADTPSFMNLLYLLETSRAYAEALQLIESAPEDKRDLPSVRVRRARLLVQTGRPADAVNDLVALLRAQPDIPEGEMILSLALSRDTDVLPDTALVEGLLRDRPELDHTRAALTMLYIRAERFAQAQTHLELLATRDPADPRVLRDLGVILFRRGELEKAEDRFRDLQAADPKDPEARRWLCRIAVARDRPDEALHEADAVQALAPSDPAALLCRASALLMLHRREEALQATEAVLQADSTQREAGLLAASILDDLGRPVEALDRLRPLVAEYPADRNILFSFAASLEQAGQVDSSLAIFDRLRAADPDDDQVLNHAGYICIDRGIRVQEGLGWVKHALDLVPDNGAYMDSYGWGLFRLGRFQEALDWLQRAAEKSPQEAEIRLHLAEVFERLRRPKDARDAYREALRLRPGDPVIRQRLEAVGSREAQPAAPEPSSK